MVISLLLLSGHYSVRLRWLVALLGMSARVRMLNPPCASLELQIIEIEIHRARVRLHGQVDAQRLGVVLDVLAQRK